MRNCFSLQDFPLFCKTGPPPSFLLSTKIPRSTLRHFHLNSIFQQFNFCPGKKVDFWHSDSHEFLYTSQDRLQTAENWQGKHLFHFNKSVYSVDCRQRISAWKRELRLRQTISVLRSVKLLLNCKQTVRSNEEIPLESRWNSIDTHFDFPNFKCVTKLMELESLR